MLGLGEGVGREVAIQFHVCPTKEGRMSPECNVKHAIDLLPVSSGRVVKLMPSPKFQLYLKGSSGDSHSLIIPSSPSEIKSESMH